MKKRFILFLLSIVCISASGCQKESSLKAEQNEEISLENHEEVNMEVDKTTVDKKSTEIGMVVGEGTSLDTLSDLSDSSKYQIGEKITFANADEKYELIIDSVVYTEQRDSHAADVEKVVLVEYTYHNLSDNPLMIGDIRFQLTNGTQDKIYQPYYFTGQHAAEPIEKGESASAQLAFVQEDDEDELFLVYTDLVSENEPPVIIQLNGLKKENK